MRLNLRQIRLSALARISTIRSNLTPVLYVIVQHICKFVLLLCPAFGRLKVIVDLLQVEAAAKGRKGEDSTNIAFRLFDIDQDGFITKEEFAQVCFKKFCSVLQIQ